MLTSACHHHAISCWGHLSPFHWSSPAEPEPAQTRPDLNLAAGEVKSETGISNNQKISTQLLKNPIISVYTQQNSKMLLKHLDYHILQEHLKLMRSLWKTCLSSSVKFHLPAGIRDMCSFVAFSTCVTAPGPPVPLSFRYFLGNANWATLALHYQSHHIFS